MGEKPLGIRAYGRIDHFPTSKVGPGDHNITAGQTRICTEKTRDKHDRVIVQEKLDGSCCAVALQNGQLIPLTRAGYGAETSPFKQHHLFANWVYTNGARFRAILKDGERLVGEWLIQAHGTLYDLAGREPFAVFDLMTNADRVPHAELMRRTVGYFHHPSLLHCGGALPIEQALLRHEEYHWPCEQIEGVVYRVERKGVVDYLAKYVRPDKIDGKWLTEHTEKPSVWNAPPYKYRY